jgi:hypothetical protein
MHGRSGVPRCDAHALAGRLAAGRGTEFDPAVVDTWVRLSASKQG